MAEYKDIHGTTIRNSAGNLAGAKTGELFYDSTNRDFKYQFPNVTTAGAWRTGGNLNDGRNAGGSAGTRDAALFYAGDPASAGTTANTESYDGATWTEVADLNTARREVFTGLGLTYTAALCVGSGTPPGAIVESWDGSSWTEVGDLNAAKGVGASSGSQTSALAYGGSGATANTESWNGSSWTEVANLNQGRSDFPGGSGVSNTSAICVGGYVTPNNIANVETWNGTSWTEVSDLNQAKRGLGSASQTETSTIVFGGYSTTTEDNTESWNGTSWTEVADLSSARNQLAGAGSDNTSAIAFGGGTSISTEEWSGQA